MDKCLEQEMRNFFRAELENPNVNRKERKKRKNRKVITTPFKNEGGYDINILYHLELKIVGNILSLLDLFTLVSLH